MAGITTYLSIVRLNVNGLNSPIKRKAGRFTKPMASENRKE
jgi:hypothetical protein